MNPAMTTNYYSEELDREMNNITMSPLSPTFNPLGESGGGFDFLPWSTAEDGSSSGFSYPYSSDAYPEERSYEYFSVPYVEHRTSESTSDSMDWAKGSSAPLSASTETTYFSAGDGEQVSSDTCLSPESDFYENVFESNPNAQERKRSTTQDGISYGYPPGELSPQDDGAYAPPSKKSRASASSSSSGGSATTAVKTKTSASVSYPTPKSRRSSDNKSKSRSSKSTNIKIEPSSPNSLATGTSGHGGNHKIQLRTAARKNKPSSSRKMSFASSTSTGPPLSADAFGEEEEDPLTPEERRQRQNHNLVEKQYRNRLNMQFERLLAVLPADRHDGDGEDGADEHHIKAGGSGDGDEKRMSKAEVLDMARRRIKKLETETKGLRKEHKDLTRKVDVMQDTIMRYRAARGRP